MLFNSYTFIFAFLPVALTGCFLLARFAGAGAAQLWLIAASFYFYASWNLRYLPLLLGSILFNYTMARFMLRLPEARRRLPLLVAVAVDLALLGYYKYANYFVDTVNQLSGAHFVIAQIMLPLGISFYTFQQITLLVDASGGEVREFRLRDFALFVIFFPHLIAGPIVHHSEMMPQFARARWRLGWENLAVGATLFIAGLFKKAVLADGIARAVAPVFLDAALGRPVSLLYAWGGMLGFALQMYFDFSGYSEMALGLARIVGITLPMNFNAPLRASSVIEYWACWHMTLTRFLTGYVYNPVAMAIARFRRARGWKQGPGPRGSLGAALSMIALPTCLTMFLSGLWHGAGNQFLVFGILHGVFLSINHLWRLYRPRFWRNAASHAAVMRPVGLVLTLLCTSFALTYFHAESVTAGNDIVLGLVGGHGLVLPDVIASRMAGLAHVLRHLGAEFQPVPLPPLLEMAGWIVALLALALLSPGLLQVTRAYQPAITLPAPYVADTRLGFARQLLGRLHWQPNAMWAFATALLGLGGILSLNQVTAFLYWQF